MLRDVSHADADLFCTSNRRRLRCVDQTYCNRANSHDLHADDDNVVSLEEIRQEIRILRLAEERRLLEVAKRLSIIEESLEDHNAPNLFECADADAYKSGVSDSQWRSSLTSIVSTLSQRLAWGVLREILRWEYVTSLQDKLARQGMGLSWLLGSSKRD